MTRAELIANIEATAAKLAGRSVSVRLEKRTGLAGCVAKNLQGECVMYLDPLLVGNVLEFARTLTHEIAHAKLHFASLPRVDMDAAPVVSEQIARATYAKRYERPADRRHEAEADQIAARWMEVIRRHHDGYTLATRDPFLAVLKILYHRTGDKTT